jgi:nucleoside-diphosphate-sugar epimerase
LESGCELFIHTSTSEVYGTAQYIPIDEKHPLQPQSPYSASKIGADMVAFSFYHSFNLPVIVARPFNTYGPRQSARAVVPTIITQLTVGKNEIRLGDLAPTRDFNYVSDTCEGYLALAACREAIGEVVNIGSNSETSIGDLFDLLKTLLKSDAVTSREEVRIRPEKSEVFRLRCDNSKLISLTGFKPHYTLEEGLINTIKWFLDKNNFSRYKPDIYNL